MAARDEERESFDSFLRGLARTPAPAAPASTERFRLGRRLGEGGFGTVYEVEDRVRGGRYAAKFLRNPQPDWLYRFKREFRELAGLEHPNLVRMHELHHDGEQWFFTMDYIDGGDLVDRLGEPFARLLPAFAQVARGLDALHAAGKIHRDVKPDNVLCTRDGRCLLADFGLVRDVDAGTNTLFAGTPRYMSPEQAAGQTLTPASDWYAFGIMLYEALTGQVPRRGTDRTHLAGGDDEELALPSTLRPDVAPELDRLCAALLDAEPARRAGGLQVLTVLGELAGAEDDEEPAPPPPPVRVAPRGRSFVGRQDLLARLLAAMAARPAAVVLCGQAGMGRTALLARFAGEAAGLGATVLAGRCAERERVPYRALDAVIDALAAHLRRLSDVEVAAVLPRDAAALAQIFPVLETIESLRRAARNLGLAPGEARRRGARALRELLARLAEQAPLVVCIDDLHTGDVDSAALLAEVLCPPDAPGLFLVATRLLGDEPGPLLARLAELRAGGLGLAIDELEVPPLAADEGIALASQELRLAGRDPAQAARLAADAGGSPLFIRRLARADGETASLDDLVRAEMHRLPPPAQRALEALAAAGRSVEVSVVGALAGPDALAALREAGLTRSRELDGHPAVELAHERYRVAVLAELGEGARRAATLALAQALEQHGHDDPERLAALYVEAGDQARASRYLALAGDRAAAALAFDHAAGLYRAAADPALRVKLVEALLAAGRATEAAEVSLEAAAGESPPVARDLRIRAAGALLCAGHFERGEALLRDTVATLGVHLPSGPRAAVARILAGEVSLRLRPPRWEPRPPGKISAAARARFDALWAAASGFAVSNPVMTAALVAPLVRAALEIGDTSHLARAMSARAMNLAIRRGTDASITSASLLSGAEAFAVDAESDAARATVRMARGVTATAEGRAEDAVAAFREAEELLRLGAGGAHAEIGRVLTLRLHGTFMMGRLADVWAEAPAIVVEAEERGNLLAASWMMSYLAWGRVLQGRIDDGLALAAALEARWPSRKFPVLDVWLGAIKVTAAVLRDPAGSRGPVEELWRSAHAAGVHRSIVVRFVLRWLRARTHLAAGAVDEAEREARSFGREPVLGAGPLATVLAAGVRAARGDRDGGLALLAVTEPQLEAYRLEHVLAAARRIRGRFMGGTAGAALVEQAEGWLRKQDVTSPDAWERVFAPGFGG